MMGRMKERSRGYHLELDKLPNRREGTAACRWEGS